MLCATVSSAPQIALTTASTISALPKRCAGPGNSPSAKRIMAYPLRRTTTPANTAETPELAVVATSSTHVCTGTITKPIAHAVNTSQKPAVATALLNGVAAVERSMRSELCALLCTITRRKPVSSSAELDRTATPARAAERSRPAPPKHRMSRYSGTACIAKNITNSTRSVAQSAPLTAVSSTSSRPQYRRTRWCRFHDARNTEVNTSVLSISRLSVTPSALR